MNSETALPLTIEYWGQQITLTEEQVVMVLYTNWHDETRWRKVIPLPVIPAFAQTPYHQENQWLLRVWDLEKNAERTYAMKDIHDWVPLSHFSEHVAQLGRKGQIT